MQASLRGMRYVSHKGQFYKPMHTHELWELAYYVKGHGTLAEEERRYRYEKGTVHVVQSGVFHDENNEADSNIILLYFNAPAELLPSGIFADRNGHVLSLLKQLRIEMQENRPYKQEMANSLLYQILLTLKRQLLPGPVESRDFNRVVQYIDENFQRPVDLRALAEKIGYSYDRFRHIFKEHTGLAPGEYLAEKRLELAKLLLEIDPSVSLTTVADECGFGSLSQFSNAFRAREGQSPTAYRRRQR